MIHSADNDQPTVPAFRRGPRDGHPRRRAASITERRVYNAGDDDDEGPKTDDENMTEARINTALSLGTASTRPPATLDEGTRCSATGDGLVTAEAMARRRHEVWNREADNDGDQHDLSSHPRRIGDDDEQPRRRPRRHLEVRMVSSGRRCTRNGGTYRRRRLRAETTFTGLDDEMVQRRRRLWVFTEDQHVVSSGSSTPSPTTACYPSWCRGRQSWTVGGTSACTPTASSTTHRKHTTTANAVTTMGTARKYVWGVDNDGRP